MNVRTAPPQLSGGARSGRLVYCIDMKAGVLSDWMATGHKWGVAQVQALGELLKSWAWLLPLAGPFLWGLAKRQATKAAEKRAAEKALKIEEIAAKIEGRLSAKAEEERARLEDVYEKRLLDKLTGILASNSVLYAAEIQQHRADDKAEFAAIHHRLYRIEKALKIEETEID